MSRERAREELSGDIGTRFSSLPTYLTSRSNVIFSLGALSNARGEERSEFHSSCD